MLAPVAHIKASVKPSPGRTTFMDRTHLLLLALFLAVLLGAALIALAVNPNIFDTGYTTSPNTMRP